MLSPKIQPNYTEEKRTKVRASFSSLLFPLNFIYFYNVEFYNLRKSNKCVWITLYQEPFADDAAVEAAAAAVDGNSINLLAFA